MARVSEAELITLFLGEVASYVPSIREGAEHFLRGTAGEDELAELHRLFHNLKSASAHVGLEKLSSGARQVELCLAGFMEAGEPLPVDLATGLRGIADLLGGLTETTMTPDMENELAQAIHNTFDDCDRTETDLATLLATETPEDEGTVDYLAEAKALLPLLLQMVPLLEKEDSLEGAGQIADRLARGFGVLLGIQDLVGQAGRNKPLRSIQSVLKRFCARPQLLEVEELAALAGDGLTLLQLNFESLEKEQVEISGPDMADVLEDVEAEDPFESEELEDDIFEAIGLADDPDELIEDPTPEEREPLEDGIGIEPDLPFADTEIDDEDVLGEIFPEDDGIPVEPEPDIDEAPDTEIDEERLLLLEIFRTECDEHLITCNDSLNKLESTVQGKAPVSADAKEHLSVLRRAIHTLKGAAAMTGFDLVARGAHCLEDVLDYLHDKATQISPSEVEMIATGVELLENLAALPGEKESVELSALEQRIALFMASPEAEAELAETPGALKESAPEETGSEQEVTASDPEVFQDDPEPVEQLDSQDLPEPAYVEGTEIEAQDVEAAENLLPMDASTLRVRLGDLDELSSIEGEMVVARGAMEKMVDEFSESLLELDNVKENLKRRAQELEVGFEVQSLYGFNPGGKGEDPGVVRDSDLDEFDPIELDRYSQLNLIIRSLNEISVDVNAIHSNLASLAANLGGQVNRQQLTMRMMQEKLLRIRMTPLSSISRVLFRTVRETSRNLGKSVGLTITGEDVYMDRIVWAKMTDPLMHILRNCVDHGIEDDAVRAERSKPGKGTITIEAEQHSRYVILTVRDDGGGVDLEAVRERIRSRGLAQSPEKLNEKELLEYLFHPSFSTRTDVSTVSGRGVGLDVVKKNIQELRGNVTLQNHPEKGVSFIFQIPFTLSVNRAVLVSAAGQSWAVPLQDVQQIRKVSAQYVEEDDGLFIHLEDKKLELVNLGAYLQLEQKKVTISDNDKEFLLLLFGHDEDLSAVFVDSVVEQREIVVKSLGTHLTHVQGVAGVTFTGTGGLIPILNLTELAAVGKARGEVLPGLEVKREAQDDVLKVLIVDDSISVRYSVARLVEGLSWQQQQAVDGVDALEQLETFTPDVIVLDIEMPRMNGYEFKSHLNNLEEFKDIPVVMLTSRASEKHRQKAEELGIQHYMTKPYEPEDFARLLGDIEAERKSAELRRNDY